MRSLYFYFFLLMIGFFGFSTFLFLTLSSKRKNCFTDNFCQAIPQWNNPNVIGQPGQFDSNKPQFSFFFSSSLLFPFSSNHIVFKGQNSNLQGPIPPFYQGFTQLWKFQMFQNGISGDLPSQLGFPFFSFSSPLPSLLHSLFFFILFF